VTYLPFTIQSSFSTGGINMATPLAKEEQYTEIQFLWAEDITGCILPE
jgi:hypothetical protein